jgi:AbrB family looped-hinge helix DNA binding protein
MPIVKIKTNRQVTIPKTIFEELRLKEGQFVEASRKQNGVFYKPKKLIDSDDALTPGDETAIRRGEAQLARGEYITLEELENELDRSSLKRGRKTTKKISH